MTRILLLYSFLVAVMPVWAQGPWMATVRQAHRPTHPAKFAGVPSTKIPVPSDAPEQTIGERLFLETRFAQYFFANSDGNINRPLASGDPLVAVVHTTSGTVPGPFQGESVNCRSCHFVDELYPTTGGTRSYADFVSRSAIPKREDGQITAAHNAGNIVDSLIASPNGMLLHRDGEFSNPASLVKSTLTGRNLGWLPTEYKQAIAHIARVIREDDGKGKLASRYGSLPYSTVLLGTAPEIPADLRIAEPFRLDVQKATDAQVVDAVSKLIVEYMNSLAFSRNTAGTHDGSPYDVFLAKNGLPAAPVPGESDLQYSQRLARALNLLENPKWVSVKDGNFKYFDQPFAFGQLELQGLKIFLRTNNEAGFERAQAQRRHFPWAALMLPSIGFAYLGVRHRRRKSASFFVAAIAACFCCLVATCGVSAVDAPKQALTGVEHTGNCITCHTPPNFIDFKFHNTGASQVEYDAVHGDGAFMALAIPDYQTRQKNPDAYLPATPQRPNATGIFRSPVDAAHPQQTDLGMWNIYANGDYPEPQAQLRKLMCGENSNCDPQQVLPRTIARFRTPTVRDLLQSDPYLHGGNIPNVEGMIVFYRKVSAMQRAGKLRNGDPLISGISIDDSDAVALAAFLRSLNEDYD